MSFRKRKRIIEEESETQEENDDSAFDDVPDILEIFEQQISLINLLDKMEFRIRKNEITESQRNKILGGCRPLPTTKTLGAQSFENPFHLWMDTYGDFFPEV